MPPVQVIGLGMSPADLSQKMLHLIAEAHILVGGRRHLAYFPDFPGRKLILGKDLQAVLEEIAAAADHYRVVVLASGDPNYYGIGAKLIARLGPERVVIHPNITAVQAASALLRLPWDDAAVVSIHGRDLQPLRELLGQRDKIFVYTSGADGPATVARLLLEQEISFYRLCVLENLGQPEQQVTWLSPAEALSRKFAPLNLVLLLAEGLATSTCYLGLPEAELAHEAGLITKSEIRAVVLAKLQLQPRQVLWDIGAGSGAVGLEATLLLPGGRVFAVEARPERVAQIRVNKRKFQAVNLEIVPGWAPACLSDLPDPQRVFIGGGGQHLPAILEVVRQRLQPGGRLVLTAVLLETLTLATHTLASWGWPTEVCQLQVCRSRPLAHSYYFQAQNPVWILSATVPQEAP